MATAGVQADFRVQLLDAFGNRRPLDTRLQARLAGDPSPVLLSQLGAADGDAILGSYLPTGTPPTPPSRTKWTRRVPHPVLIGHAVSLTPY